jgi:hypothetical protein
MKTGIVLAINNEFVTLLTPEGEFLKARKDKSSYEIGTEIAFTPYSGNKQKRSSFLQFSIWKASVAGAAAVLLLIFTILPAFLNDKVSAYMTIDINPSIEIGLDDDLRVVELNGLNSDGKKVIKQVHDWEHQKINDVTTKIIELSKKLGYMEKDDKEILFSTTILDKNDKLGQSLENKINEITMENEDISESVKIIEATEKQRKQAQKEGISTGKYVEKKKKQENSKEAKNKNHEKNAGITAESLNESKPGNKNKEKHNIPHPNDKQIKIKKHSTSKADDDHEKGPESATHSLKSHKETKEKHYDRYEKETKEKHDDKRGNHSKQWKSQKEDIVPDSKINSDKDDDDEQHRDSGNKARIKQKNDHHKKHENSDKKNSQKKIKERQ